MIALQHFVDVVVALRWVLVLVGFAVAGGVIADLRVRLSAEQKLNDALLANHAGHRPRPPVVRLPPKRMENR